MAFPRPESAPRFREHLERVVNLIAAYKESKKYDENDHFAFMALTFLSKQHTHARTIATLQDSRDSLLIARTMLEGLMLLLWTELEPAERALQWRAFAIVHDWRLFQQLVARGESFEQAKLDETELRLKGYRKLVFKPGALKDLSAGRPLPPDPYRKHWPTVTLEDIFNEVGEPQLYGGIYAHFCAYHHWAITGFVGSLRRNQSYVGYVDVNPTDGIMAVLCAAACLTQTAQIRNKAVPFCPMEELDKLAEDARIIYRGASESAFR